MEDLVGILITYLIPALFVIWAIRSMGESISKGSRGLSKDEKDEEE